MNSESSKSEKNFRLLRVENSIRDIIAQAVVRGIQGVPRGPVSIVRVQCTSDLKHARVYVSVFSNKADEREDLEESVIDALEAVSSDLFSQLNRALRLKFTPRLEFCIDRGIDKMLRITEILAGDEKRRTTGASAGVQL